MLSLMWTLVASLESKPSLTKATSSAFAPV